MVAAQLCLYNHTPSHKFKGFSYPAPRSLRCCFAKQQIFKMLRKAGSHVEKLFRKSHSSRQATEGALNASATAAASGTTESKGNSAPATRNTIELVKKFDEVIAGLGTSGPSFCFYCN
jgi:hypothetical protein